MTYLRLNYLPTYIFSRQQKTPEDWGVEYLVNMALSLLLLLFGVVFIFIGFFHPFSIAHFQEKNK